MSIDLRQASIGIFPSRLGSPIKSASKAVQSLAAFDVIAEVGKQVRSPVYDVLFIHLVYPAISVLKSKKRKV